MRELFVDIYYDYFLHRHWSKFSDGEEMSVFIEDVHTGIWEASLTGHRRLPRRQSGRLIFSEMADGIREPWTELNGLFIRVSHRSPILSSIFEASEVFIRLASGNGGALSDLLP